MVGRCRCQPRAARAAADRRRGLPLCRRTRRRAGKRLLAAAALGLLALLARPAAARAGCHGGGPGGGGGHGGGGSGGAAACTDRSDVVGVRRCTPFGAWATNLGIPRIVVEGGAIVRQFGSLLDRQAGSVTHGTESFAYRVLTPPRARLVDTAVLSTLRAGLGLPHGLYAAAEADLGGFTHAAPVATEMLSTGAFGSPDLQQERGFLLDSLAAVGVRGETHGVGLGAELAGGVRAASYSFESSYHGCLQTTSVTAVAPIAEARVRGELWVSPWLTAGLTAGASVLEHHAWMGGLYLGLHTRAFGGER